MRKTERCDTCGQETCYTYYCDNCGKQVYFPIPFSLLWFFIEYHFCSLECLKIFTIQEIHKTSKDENIEFGNT